MGPFGYMNCTDIYSTALMEFVHKPTDLSNYMWHKSKIKHKYKSWTKTVLHNPFTSQSSESQEVLNFGTYTYYLWPQLFSCFFRHVCTLTVNAYYLHHVCLHISVGLPLNRDPWNLAFVTFMKICQGIPNLVIIGHFTWRLKYVLLLLVTLNHHNIALFDWNGICSIKIFP